ncbi:hypothetical protein Ahy_B01g052384 isoform A [Arachis hypogaea]|uniref:Translation elongation factor P/YeiP central domain-containing protein n=1 Tax=Arachis hypogaea TaxID=3818 RepID=A0A445APA0_ARAHY|nr:hypothetical protein Ahy_B01g052384 isoform A [Arachis hypogaea]
MRLIKRVFPSNPLLFRLLSSYSHYSTYSSSFSIFNPNSLPLSSSSFASSSNFDLFSNPWSTLQSRGIKVSASDVRVGNIIEKQGRFFEVLKADHSHEGRGKATIKVELRDIAQGNKVTHRMNTDDNIERAFVNEKTFMYMCMDHDGTVVLMDPNTFDQIEVSRDLFGKNASYLQGEMKVKVQFFDEKPLSASVPKRVTCTVKEGIAATPRYMTLSIVKLDSNVFPISDTIYRLPKYLSRLLLWNKKVVLENGIIVEVPPHIVAGDAIVINTEDDSYLERLVGPKHSNSNDDLRRDLHNTNIRHTVLVWSFELDNVTYRKIIEEGSSGKLGLQ